MSQITVPASDLTGATGQNGQQISNVEIPEFEPLDGSLGRNEVAELVHSWHQLVTYPNSTETADGTVRAIWSRGTGPVENININALAPNEPDQGGTTNTGVRSEQSDDFDAIFFGTALGFAPMSDGATGVGGAGSATPVVYEMPYYDLFGGGPILDHRDVIVDTAAFNAWNIDDAAIHAELSSVYHYAIHEDQ